MPGQPEAVEWSSATVLVQSTRNHHSPRHEPGGSYLRSYDGHVYLEKTWPATVSAVRLDRFEVTVGRFRPFVDAVVAGWRPPVGSGKHTHLGNGSGIAGETGWGADWNLWIPTTKATWEDADHLLCDTALQSWTSVPGPNENRAVNCVNWFQAYAFCIWDQAFLPTEAEWNYAAAAGDEQREYPWGRPFPRPISPSTSVATEAHRGARGPLGAAPWATGNLDKRTSLAIAGNGCSIRATTPLTGLVAPRARHARVIRPPAATTARTSDKLSRTPRAVAATPTQPRICAQRCVTPTVPTMP